MITANVGRAWPNTFIADAFSSITSAGVIRSEHILHFTFKVLSISLLFLLPLRVV